MGERIAMRDVRTMRWAVAQGCIRLLTLSVALALCGLAAGQDPSMYLLRQRQALHANPSLAASPCTVMVRFKQGTSAAAKATVRASIAGTLVRSFKLVPNLEQLGFDMSVASALAILRANANVQYAEPEFVRRKMSTLPDDPFFTQQWAVSPNPLQTDTRATAAWDLYTGGTDAPIAIVDSGFKYDHEDLALNAWTNPDEILDGIDNDGNGKIDDIRGWDFVDNDNDPQDATAEGHGTRIAGIIGARGNNQIGISGVNWVTKMINVKVFDDIATFSAGVIGGWEYARGKGSRVSSNSFGAVGADKFSEAEYDAIRLAQADRMLFVCAAGNGGTDNDLVPVYPASYSVAFDETHPGLDNVIAVAATTSTDEFSPVSNYGFNSVHLAAPGDDVLSTDKAGAYSTGEAGTSYAAAHVAGAVAMLESYRKDLPYLGIKLAIINNTRPTASCAQRTMTGGTLDLARALLSLKPGQMSLLPDEITGKGTALATITLSFFAPPGGLKFFLTSNHAKVKVPTAVWVQAGTTTAQFLVTVDGVSVDSSATITAETEAGHKLDASLTLHPDPLEQLTITPTSVVGGGQSTGTVLLKSNAPTGGTVVYLFEDSPRVTVPTTVFIRGGTRSSNFTISTVPTPGTVSVPITAILGSVNRVATLTVQKPGLALLLASSVHTGGAVLPLTIKLSGFAPAWDPDPAKNLKVSLWDNTAVATTPTPIVVYGNDTFIVNVATVPVATNTSATFTAAMPGSVNRTATVTIQPPIFVSHTVSPAILASTYPTTGTVTLNQAAPAGGITVSLWGGGQYVLWRPASVTIPAGSNAQTYMLITKEVSVATTFTVSAQIGSAVKTATLTTYPPPPKP